MRRWGKMEDKEQEIINRAIFGKKKKGMKFEIISIPDNGNGDAEKPGEALERPLREIMADFSALQKDSSRKRWGKNLKGEEGEETDSPDSPDSSQIPIKQKGADGPGNGDLTGNRSVPNELGNEACQIHRKPRRWKSPALPDWSPEEKGYMRQCFKYWKGLTKGEEPTIPPGISKVKADILKYKSKTIADSTERKKRMDETVTISFRATKEFSKEVSADAAEADLSLSVFIRACISLASPQILAHPKIIGFFTDSVFPK
jgi:hypothetical protein